jgi:hypothetical protein
MRTPLLAQSIVAEPKPRPFPTRGVPGGWHDPWDADPQDAVLAALQQRNASRRHFREAGMQFDLAAHARADGRWEAHVVPGDGPAVMWPSTNGPTATRALDALEAELRAGLGGGGVVRDADH